MTKPTPLSIIEHTFPNGDVYGEFWIDGEQIGKANKAPAGWIPFGKRNVLTDSQAAVKMLQDKIAAARKAEMEAKRLLDILKGRQPK